MAKGAPSELGSLGGGMSSAASTMNNAALRQALGGLPTGGQMPWRPAPFNQPPRAPAAPQGGMPAQSPSSASPWWMNSPLYPTNKLAAPPTPAAAPVAIAPWPNPGGSPGGSPAQAAFEAKRAELMQKKGLFGATPAPDDPGFRRPTAEQLAAGADNAAFRNAYQSG